MKGMKCVWCGSIAPEARLRFQGQELDGWKCHKCGEQYLDPLQAGRILLLHKLQKSKFTVTLGQIKSNLILRIPKEAQQAMGLHKGEKVKLSIPTQKKMEMEKE